jgi:hypothetical protein
VEKDGRFSNSNGFRSIYANNDHSYVYDGHGGNFEIDGIGLKDDVKSKLEIMIEIPMTAADKVKVIVEFPKFDFSAATTRETLLKLGAFSGSDRPYFTHNKKTVYKILEINKDIKDTSTNCIKYVYGGTEVWAKLHEIEIWNDPMEFRTENLRMDMERMTGPPSGYEVIPKDKNDMRRYIVKSLRSDKITVYKGVHGSGETKTIRPNEVLAVERNDRGRQHQHIMRALEGIDSKYTNDEIENVVERFPGYDCALADPNETTKLIEMAKVWKEYGDSSAIRVDTKYRTYVKLEINDRVRFNQWGEIFQVATTGGGGPKMNLMLIEKVHNVKMYKLNELKPDRVVYYRMIDGYGLYRVGTITKIDHNQAIHTTTSKTPVYDVDVQYIIHNNDQEIVQLNHLLTDLKGQDAIMKNGFDFTKAVREGKFPKITKQNFKDLLKPFAFSKGVKGWFESPIYSLMDFLMDHKFQGQKETKRDAHFGRPYLL